MRLNVAASHFSMNLLTSELNTFSQTNFKKKKIRKEYMQSIEA